MRKPNDPVPKDLGWIWLFVSDKKIQIIEEYKKFYFLINEEFNNNISNKKKSDQND